MDKMELNNRIDLESIKKFWIWFSLNCQNFGNYFDNSNLINELDIWINKLGNFTWEIGPGKNTDNALIISPNGDVEKLKFTKMIIANAISCEGWEYYYAKPPKQWNDFKFYFETTNGNRFEVDASLWEYVLLKYEDGMYGIVIKSLQLSELDGDDTIIAMEIFLDGILGEKIRMQTIDYI